VEDLDFVLLEELDVRIDGELDVRRALPPLDGTDRAIQRIGCPQADRRKEQTNARTVRLIIVF